LKDGAIEDESVEFAVFTARVGVRRKIAEEGFVEFAAGETGIEDFGVNACGDGAETVFVEATDQFARIALPDGEERGHADAGEIFFAVGAEVFQEDIAESDRADALGEVNAQGFLHARFVDGIDALPRDEDFVKRETDGFGLALEKFAADTVHGDAVVGLGDGGEQGYDVESLLLEQGVQGHGAVFAAAPAEEDGFECCQENLLKQ